MAEPQFTKRFHSWVKKRPNNMRPLIKLFPPGTYKIKDGAPYAISAPGTIVKLHSYGKMQVNVPVMVSYRDQNDVEHSRQVFKPKWVQSVQVVVPPENKLPEAIERENMMARENVQGRVMDEIFTRAQRELTDKYIAEIPKDYTDVEEKKVAELEAIKAERDFTDDEKELYKTWTEAFHKKEQEQAQIVTDKVKEAMATTEIKKPLLDEAAAIMEKAETKKEIEDLAAKFHKDPVLVQVQPEHLELIEISPDILVPTLLTA